ncbi:alkanesulfonate monooxygenase [Parafrankia irregularis]|uniref:Alkanesulfonate monooxygenase n=1 Tax=Parafrankia irregularis TaxID=795642 RepID=A0A0S4QSL6_9ACTN|nr:MULTISPECIES: LLM class flavin-dependent oxidoreductase [Parafrankia]MBE3199865.1 LLM class flavin-dependent oxidoreductase [Parafrankia sp. CH37]CUU58018.1 alkanesulfonate monooxygenase [Parafrankia irregularis]
MAIEILGMVGTKEVSETRGSYFDGPAVDAAYLTRFAQAHDEAGFDRVLIGYGATAPDGFAVAGHVLAHTRRLGVLIAHRPGFVAPTLAARKLATLDQLSGGGRVAIHHISGGNDADQRRDGDFADHDTRYARTAEFMDVLRRTLTSDAPFDHEGPFYRFEGAYSSVKPATAAGIPLFFGGQSEAAVEVGARHADVYMLFGEPLEQTAERIALLRAQAAKHGRTLRFSLSTRPIVAATEEAAWARAETIAAETRRRAEAARVSAALVAGPAGSSGPAGSAGSAAAGRALFATSGSVASARLQEVAARQQVYDERLWFGVTALTGPGGNSSGHVGTPQQVADALLRYHEIGVDTFLIRGFDPYDDVVDWGRELIPALRAGASRAREVVHS